MYLKKLEEYFYFQIHAANNNGACISILAEKSENLS